MTIQEIHECWNRSIKERDEALKEQMEEGKPKLSLEEIVSVQQADLRLMMQALHYLIQNLKESNDNPPNITNTSNN